MFCSQPPVCVTPCRLYSEPPEATVSLNLSEQQLVSSLMLFCQKCFGCWCLSNQSLQKFHLQDKRPNTTCCLAQWLENVANSSWLFFSSQLQLSLFKAQSSGQCWSFFFFFCIFCLLKLNKLHVSLTFILSRTVDLVELRLTHVLNPGG